MLSATFSKSYLPVFSEDTKLLYCASVYPAMESDLFMSEVKFGDKWYGYSNHTIGISACAVAIAKGASMIEKHFALNNKGNGPDYIISMTPDELETLANYERVVTASEPKKKGRDFYGADWGTYGTVGKCQ